MLIDWYDKTKHLIFFLGLDPEKMHDKAISYMKKVQENEEKLEQIAEKFNFLSGRISIKINNFYYKNPIGLAAGFDKNAYLTNFIQALNFGFEEVGSITNLQCNGNDGKRLVRDSKRKALRNRMGLNGEGVNSIISSGRLQIKNKSYKFPQWINFTISNHPEIMGNKAIDDILICYNKICDYGKVNVLNVSCPNTKDGKTFEDPIVFEDLLKEIELIKPEESQLFVKYSPKADSTGLTKIALKYGIAGVVQGNTMSVEDTKIGRCGESGEPLYEQTIKQVHSLYLSFRDEIPIIACGGISKGYQALEAIKHGATAIELLSGLIYEGPKVSYRICKYLDSAVKEVGKNNIRELVGIEVNHSK